MISLVCSDYRSEIIYLGTTIFVTPFIIFLSYMDILKYIYYILFKINLVVLTMGFNTFIF